MIIHGPTPLHGATMDSYGNNRLGMMAATAALVTSGPVFIQDPACINIHIRDFLKT